MSDRPAEPRRGTTRREVVRALAGCAVVAGMPLAARAEDEASTPAPALPRRPLGKLGVEVGVFGLGCFPLGSLANEREAVEVVEAALAEGCTYFDTAPSYSRGASERRVGLAIKARGNVRGLVIATKTTERSGDAARRDLEGSLTRLGLDRVHLLQVHALSNEADLERILADKDGVLRAAVRAQEEGIVGHIGITCHGDPAVLAAALERFPFDAVLMPLNCVDPHHASFISTALPVAVEKGIARIAMKVFASGGLPRKEISPEACLRYTYGLDVATAVVGCLSKEEVALAARVARENRPLSADEQSALVDSTAAYKGKPLEWYKKD